MKQKVSFHKIFSQAMSVGQVFVNFTSIGLSVYTQVDTQ